MVGALRSPAKREMAANIMTVYAAWDSHTEDYLRGEADDVYVRALFSFLPDDEREDDPEHKTCTFCQTEYVGARWVPDNGGAWVNSNSWADAEHDPETYISMSPNYPFLVS